MPWVEVAVGKVRSRGRAWGTGREGDLPSVGPTDLEVLCVLISGGTSQLSGIMEVFQQHFGKPTNFWDPLEGLQLELPAHQQGQLKSHARTVAVALGLAARVQTLS